MYVGAVNFRFSGYKGAPFMFGECAHKPMVQIYSGHTEDGSFRIATSGFQTTSSPLLFPFFGTDTSYR